MAPFKSPGFEDEGFLPFIRKAIGLSESISIDLYPLEGRGSERSFYRLKWDQKDSAILIHFDPDRKENTLYAGIASFLFRRNIPVPKVISHDPRACFIIIEDLGDVSLWSLRKRPWEYLRTLYRKTLQVAHRIHAISEEEFPDGEVELMEGFGPHLYQWEQEYFKEYFIRKVCRIDLPFPFQEKLEGELFDLRDRLSKGKRTLIHRDLQSQNVMVRENQVFLIDFQGMRFGNPFYDLGSLLCDPYMDFLEEQREDLLAYYYELSPKGLDWETFKNCFWEASAQRLMQALGAFGFLGVKKGLRSYLDHIPQGLKNLWLATSKVPTLSTLQELSTTLLSALELIHNSNEKI